MLFFFQIHAWLVVLNLYIGEIRKVMPNDSAPELRDPLLWLLSPSAEILAILIIYIFHPLLLPIAPAYILSTLPHQAHQQHIYLINKTILIALFGCLFLKPLNQGKRRSLRTLLLQNKMAIHAEQVLMKLRKNRFSMTPDS